MSVSPNSMQILEGVIEHGVPFAAKHLFKKLKKEILIIDNHGNRYFPEKELDISLVDLILASPQLKDGEYYYEENKCLLFYAIGQSDTQILVIIKQLPAEQISYAVSVIADTHLSLKNYICIITQVRINSDQFACNFMESILYKSCSDIRDILKPNEINLFLDKPYLIKLIRIDDSQKDVNFHLMRADILEYVKRRKLEIISPILWNGLIMLIIPARYKADTLEIEPEWPKVSDTELWLQDAEKKFGVTLSAGLGQAYTLQDLNKSYNEARITLTLSSLMGRKGVVLRFTDLGVFTHIFTQDIDLLQYYCLKSIGDLLKYDSSTSSTNLLSTLRILLDNGFNWKLTAKSLYIHVSTLRYRYEKIEKLLNVDLSKSFTQVNLYIAVKVWDAINTLGYVKNDANLLPAEHSQHKIV